MAERYYCDRCGESYHEENIDSCRKCRRTVCPRCAGLSTQAGGTRVWMCDACAPAGTK